MSASSRLTQPSGEHALTRSNGREVSLRHLLPGVLTENSHGRLYTATLSYPLSHYQGANQLSDFHDLCTRSLSRLCKEPSLEGLDPKRALFLDTETTGLDAASGALVFMVGAAYFEEETLEVRQFFMDTPAAEAAMLKALVEHLGPFEILVTFNGKAFDVPMLARGLSRHGLAHGLNQMPHADLLLASRRLWKKRVRSCRLANLERMILGVGRTGDVPGREIPALYAQYLQDYDAARLLPVFYHNAQDLLTLVSLTTQAVAVYKEPFQGLVRAGPDFLSLGRMYEEAGEVERALQAYNRALSMPLQSAVREDLCRRLSQLYRKGAQADNKVARWEALIASGEVHSVFPFEELAKHYEHDAQNYARAEELVLEAMLRLPGDVCTHTTQRDLEKRLRRIHAKRTANLG